MHAEFDLATPVSYQATGPKAPCDELAPFGRDERIWWAFRCGAKRALRKSADSSENRNGDQSLDQLIQKLERWSLSDISTFVSAYQLGVIRGGAEAFVRYQDDIVALVASVLKPAIDVMDATYDIEIYKRMQRFYGAAPGSEAQVESLRSVADYFASDYPSLAEGVRTLVVVGAAMRELKRWMETDVNAPSRIAMVVSGELGKVLGEEALVLLAVAGSPAKLGDELGRLLGSAFVEVVLVLFGF